MPKSLLMTLLTKNQKPKTKKFFSLQTKRLACLLRAWTAF